MSSSAIHRWCPDCSDVTDFVVPPCEDGHGEDCLDLACADCGAAVVLGRHDDAESFSVAA